MIKKLIDAEKSVPSETGPLDALAALLELKKKVGSNAGITVNFADLSTRSASNKETGDEDNLDKAA